MATVELNSSNFKEAITGNDIVFVDFWASWCGPCKTFAPIYEAAAEKYPEILFAKINTEDEQDLAASFQIRSIPTLMIFREQIVLFSQPGMLPQSVLEDLITKTKALDMDQVRADIEKKAASTEGV